MVSRRSAPTLYLFVASFPTVETIPAAETVPLANAGWAGRSVRRVRLSGSSRPMDSDCWGPRLRDGELDGGALLTVADVVPVAAANVDAVGDSSLDHPSPVNASLSLIVAAVMSNVQRGCGTTASRSVRTAPDGWHRRPRRNGPFVPRHRVGGVGDWPGPGCPSVKIRTGLEYGTAARETH